MRVTQTTCYYLSKSGRFGNFFTRNNVSPYSSVWKIVTKVYSGKTTRVKKMDPICIFPNVYGINDPDIPIRIRAKLKTMEDLYYEH